MMTVKSEEMLKALITGESTPETVKAIADIQAAILMETADQAKKLDDMTAKYQALQASYIELVKASAFPEKPDVNEPQGEVTFESLIAKAKAKGEK